MKLTLKKVLQILAFVPVFALSLSTLAPAAATYAAPTFADDVTCEPGIGEDPLQNGANCAKGSGTSDQLFGENSVFKMVVNILLFIVGAISVIMLIIGGIRYVVSGGDQNAVQGAKNTILYAIIGIVIAFLAFAAVNFVLGGLNPND